MSVPGKCHKDIRYDQQQNGIESFHNNLIQINLFYPVITLPVHWSYFPKYCNAPPGSSLPTAVKFLSYHSGWTAIHKDNSSLLLIMAQSCQFYQIALGHHMDDILETLLMNITYQGAFSTMPPRLVMKKFDMTIIRPMCLVHEADFIASVFLSNCEQGFPTVP